MTAELNDEISSVHMHAKVFVDVHVVKGNMVSVAINMNMVSRSQKARTEGILVSHDASAAAARRESGQQQPKDYRVPTFRNRF